jgi:hypothetical protein
MGQVLTAGKLACPLPITATSACSAVAAVEHALPMPWSGDGAQAGSKPLPTPTLDNAPKCMTPRRIKLEEALKVSSKFSGKFLQKPESVLLFSLDTVEHVGYDRRDELHQTCGHSRAPDPLVSSCMTSGVGRMRSLRGARRGP